MGWLGKWFGASGAQEEVPEAETVLPEQPAEPQGYPARLAELQQNARAFWADWQREEARLSSLPPVELVEEGNALLQRHCPDVVLELEGAAGGADGAVLVFSGNGVRGHFPQVQALAETAQTQRYGVRAFRSRTSGHAPEFGIRMDGFELSAGDVRVQCESWRGLAALEIGFAKEIDAERLPHAQNMAFIMLDHVVGEWDAAVKIGAVDFVDAPPEGAVPLHELPAKLDQVWRGLGRSGLYPEPEWQYGTYQVEEDEAQDALVLVRNESASALLGRADMAWCVSVSCVLGGKEDLETAYALHDAFDAEAAVRQQGIPTLALTNLSRGVRTVYAATSEPQALLERVQALCTRFAGLQAEAACEYDPNWSHYRL